MSNLPTPKMIAMPSKNCPKATVERAKGRIRRRRERQMANGIMPLTYMNVMSHAASNSNPPKGYGSIELGIEVAKYRNERIDFWFKELELDSYTDEVFQRANKDVIDKFGKPR